MTVFTMGFVAEGPNEGDGIPHAEMMMRDEARLLSSLR